MPENMQDWLDSLTMDQWRAANGRAVQIMKRSLRCHFRGDPVKIARIECARVLSKAAAGEGEGEKAVLILLLVGRELGRMEKEAQRE